MGRVLFLFLGKRKIILGARRLEGKTNKLEGFQWMK
jgi:hypothetical protein